MFVLPTVFSGDDLLLNCKLMSNARVTSPDGTPNVDNERQRVTLVHLLLLFDRRRGTVHFKRASTQTVA